MKTHHYALRLRPPGPGCQPMDGLIRVTSEPVYCYGKRCWGTAVYNRKLTDKEKEHYDLEYIGEFDE